jgi:hypothetical protein
MNPPFSALQLNPQFLSRIKLYLEDKYAAPPNFPDSAKQDMKKVSVISLGRLLDV